MHSNSASTRGMAVAPHHLAGQSVLAILREDDSTIEAMVTAAATVVVVYPCMNSLGGDGFWLIIPPEGDPIATDASGATESLATFEAYTGQQHIPHRGPQATLTVASTVSGWDETLRISRDLAGHALSVTRLLADAIDHTGDGIPVTASQAHATASKLGELHHQPDFSETWLVAGEAPRPGSRFRQPALAGTLRVLASDGLDSFYCEPLAERLAQGVATLGVPITLGDLQTHRVRHPAPLTLQRQQDTLWNLMPPAQGLVSLAILGVTDRLDMADADGMQTVYRIIEATKRAFALCDAHITDPHHLDVDVQQLLTPETLQPLADSIDDASTFPWGRGRGPGNTAWMGVVDNSGLVVSLIQNIYHEFGSGVVLPDTRIIWQDRGAAFSLGPQHLLALTPDKQPFHTLNPAAIRLNDGRVMVYGSVSGDGQPQTQATLSTRCILQGVPLQEGISRSRWLLDRTQDQSSDSLELGERFAPACIARLRELGHEVEVLTDLSEAMDHAGAIVRHPNDLLEGATDPRSNGAAAGC